ncbi:hypothetical protein Scep_019525 [Stephania cephalantha]|uniref:Uncharacterized protein n=1 Tax=Stephania cephalantha TaxID=152367 RepID=A0AAP0IBY0_9MAGN
MIVYLDAAFFFVLPQLIASLCLFGLQSSPKQEVRNRLQLDGQSLQVPIKLTRIS